MIFSKRGSPASASIDAYSILLTYSNVLQRILDHGSEKGLPRG
jgi:hypothetical protein